MRLGQRGEQEEGREMHRGGGRGEEVLSGPSAPGSGRSGAPRGRFAQFPALPAAPPPPRAGQSCHWPLPPLARASVLALGWDRAPSPGSAVKGCLEKHRIHFSSAPSSSLAPGCQGKTLTPKPGTFLEAQPMGNMLP